MRASARSGLVLLWLCASCGRCARPPQARLDAIGPRIVSNQTAYPVMLYGSGFTAGLRLRLGPPFSIELPTALVDERHLTAQIPPLPIEAEQPEATAPAQLISAEGRELQGSAPLLVINDTGYPTPTGLAVSGDGQRIFALSSTTDELWSWRRDGSAPERIPVGDGPRALALTGSGASEQLVIAHEFSPELRLVSTKDPHAPQRSLAVRAGAIGLAVDSARGIAFLANHRSNTVQVIELASGRGLHELPAGVRPRSLALDGYGQLIGAANAGSADLSLYAPGISGERRVQPRPGTQLVGGHNERWERFVMGGLQPRALVWSEHCKRLFVASAGLNIGPNPGRMEISTNGGIGVVDPASARWERHVSLLAGIPQALVLDGARGLLWAADLSRGLLVAFEEGKLCTTEADARRSIIARLKLPIPEGTALLRPAADFTAERRAGTEIHSGPESLALADGGRTVLVLSRFDGGVTEVDVSNPKDPKVRRLLPGPPMNAQPARRLGEVAFFTDLGRSTMSCDGCHPGGHDGGVLFTKTHPLRIYRSPSLRDVRETPPYFFPGAFPDLDLTGEVVMGRNRLHNPDPTRREIEVLRLYQQGIAALPNPFLGPGGALPDSLRLPDGKTGNPRRGLALFEGNVGCSAKECHPAPQFTGDQSPETRGLAHDVGTPVTQPLRPEWLEAPPGPHAVPSLTGAWDEFPLLASGAGGFDVAADGALEPLHPFALRRVLEWQGSRPHGETSALSAQDKDDLLAYLLTL